MSFDRGMEDGYYGGYSERLYNRSESYREGFDYGQSMAEAQWRAAEEHAAYEAWCEEEAARHYAELETEWRAESLADAAWDDDGGAQ